MNGVAWADGRIETMFIESGDEAVPSREIRVWLPPGYDDGRTHYPVIYFHDGQNVFRPGGPFGCWFAEDAATKEINAGLMREAILVALPNNEADTGRARMTEYQSPTDANPRDQQRGNGICDRYASFLLEKVKPVVDAKYRTLPDRENTAVAGASMGGLVSLWLGLNTDAFGAVGVFSPAFWTSPNFTKSVMEGSKKDGLRIYMDMGTDEKGNLTGDYWLDALAVRHVRYGVQDRHYTIVGKALAQTLALMLGRTFDPEMRAAWDEIYATISARMIEAAHRDMPSFAVSRV